MSNLIKSNYIYFDHGDKRVINSDVRYSNFVPFVPTQATPQNHTNVSGGSNEFVEGFNIVNMDQVIQQEKETISQQAEAMLEEAKAQAEQILLDARNQAEQLKQEAYEEGKNLGYADGLKEGENSCNQIKFELQNRIEQLERDYEEHLSRLEPDFVDVLIGLIEKLTGILVEDNREVILYLMDRAMKQEEKSNHFLVKVSKEDYLILESQQAKIDSLIGGNAVIDIREDKTLGKNQCVIETDNKIIDCSLDVQLKRLIEDLKLLSHI